MESILNKNILIVDDDERMLRALTKVLTNEGAVITGACWAAEAMDQLADPQKRFDLVITDLQMPFVRGSTILRMIARSLQPGANQPVSNVEGEVSQGVFPRVPIIVLTAFGSPEVKTECLLFGAAAFLEKPLNITQLLAAIEDAFAQQKNGRENHKAEFK